MSATDMRAQLAAIGDAMGPEVVARTRSLFAPEQEALAARMPASLTDAVYGLDPRHRLDLYRDERLSGGQRPVLLFVHGGGFVMGDKGGGPVEHWPNAHVGRWAARCGMLGAVMNYRLAPDNMWPSGAEDVAAAVGWLQANAAQHGGDPTRIVVMGTSAGSVHVAGYLDADPDHARHVRAAVLLSGLYGYCAIDAKDERYYGAPDLYPERMPRRGVEETRLPLFLACARFDPPRFQAEWLGLMGARHARHGQLARGYFSNTHTHYSLAMHIGTSDHALTNEIEAFLADTLTGENHAD